MYRTAVADKNGTFKMMEIKNASVEIIVVIKNNIMFINQINVFQVVKKLIQ